MDMYYAFDNDGNRYGPVNVDGLNGWIREGRLLPHNSAEDAETGVRMALGEVPGIQLGQFANQFSQPPVQATHASYPRSDYGAKIENHLTKAIFATVCCCMPLGVVSIVHAARVDGLVRTGHVEEAQRTSQLASTWSDWSIGIGVVLSLLYAITMMASTSMR